jgi:general secretion pathway protein I
MFRPGDTPLEGGFTLLEVMISLAILAGVVVTVIGAVNQHLTLAARDREETVAVLLARGKLADPDFAGQEANSGSFAPTWPDYTWRRELLPTDVPGLRRLILTVQWQQARRTLALVQYVAK